MKRIALIILSLSLLCQAAAAQQTWFCSEAGTRLTYVQKDAAGALQNGTMQYAVRDVQQTGSVTRIGYDVIVTDVAGASKTFTGSCAQTDGKSFTQDAGAFMGQFGTGLDVKGGAPAIPETPSVGAAAEDCSIVIDALMADARYSNIRFTKSNAPGDGPILILSATAPRIAQRELVVEHLRDLDYVRYLEDF